MSNPLAAFIYRYNLVGDNDDSFEKAITLASRADVAIADLVHQLSTLPNADDAAVQLIYYNIGNEYFPGDLRTWFKIVYCALIGEASGPRLGLLTMLLGIEQTCAMIDRVRFTGWMFADAIVTRIQPSKRNITYPDPKAVPEPEPVKKGFFDVMKSHFA